MYINTSRPTRPGPAGDVARRLALWVGPGIAARDDTVGAALYLALGATIAATRAFTAQSLLEGVGLFAVDTLPLWERSLGMLSGEGSSIEARQLAVTARWRATRAGPSLAAITRTVRTLVPLATVLETAMDDVYWTWPLATAHLAILLPDADEDNAGTRGLLSAALAVQAPAQVSWALGRGDGPDIDAFRCDDPESLCDRDLLSA